MKPFDAYMICTSPRSGSTLLCKLLQEVTAAGVPDSHFHNPSLDAWRGYYGLSDQTFPNDQSALRAVVQAAYRRGKGQGDIFGLRMQHQSFAYFTKQLAVLYPDHPNDVSRIQAAFGTTLFVRLTRQDKLDQAISFVRATQSGLWHKAADGTEIERLSPPKAPVYDADAIAQSLVQFQMMEEGWTTWFADHNISPLCVTYADLSVAPYDTLDLVLDTLGIPVDRPVTGVPPVAKLADATSRAWAERFRAETKA